MTFPTGFQSFIDSSTPTPANLLEQQPFASPILPGGEWGGRVSELKELFREPTHNLGEMPSYFKLCNPETVYLSVGVFLP